MSPWIAETRHSEMTNVISDQIVVKKTNYNELLINETHCSRDKHYIWKMSFIKTLSTTVLLSLF